MGFFSSFFGNDQANDIQAASERARQEYQQGLANFTNTTKDYLGQSLGFLQPYAQAGGQTLDLLGNALGINGNGPQQSFFSNLQTEPGYASGQAAGIDALDKSAAARGMLRSGGQQRDLYSFGNRYMNDYANNRISQLGGLLTPTMGAAGSSADLTNQAGNNIAGAQFGTGQLFANNATNTGNALAQSRGIGINNILGALNAGANIAKSAAMFSDIRLKENIRKVGMLDNGLPVYVYNYKGSNMPMIGVMAQDVEKVRPEAVSEIGGYKAIRYDIAVN